LFDQKSVGLYNSWYMKGQGNYTFAQYTVAHMMLSFLVPFFAIRINPDYGWWGVLYFSIPGISLYNLIGIVFPQVILFLISKFMKLNNRFVRFFGINISMLCILLFLVILLNITGYIVNLDFNLLIGYFYLLSFFLLLFVMVTSKNPTKNKSI
jgi:hypothetical protein